MEKLLIIDANAFIHRSFHALPPFSSPEGKPTGALYGLSNTLVKIMENHIPDYAVAAFDTPEKTFRKKMFDEYKAHRPKAPDELIEQIIEAEKLFKKFGIKVLKKPGFEADDVIGTLVEKLKNLKNLKINILTGDLDTLQLIDNSRITVLTPKRGVSNMFEYNEKAVINRFKVPPELIPDYKGLVGDSSDNIPGIAGVGPKTADKLMQGEKTIETIYEIIDGKKELDKLEKKILGSKEVALLSKKLATIDRNVPIEIKLENLKYNMEHTSELINYLKDLGFKTLPSKLTGKEKNKEDFIKQDCLIFKKEDFEKITKEVKKKLESNKIKVAFDWKEIIKKTEENIEIKEPLFDVKIAKWLIDPDKKNYQLTEKESDDLQSTFHTLSKKLNNEKLMRVFKEIDMPLVKVLASMEACGITINKKILESIRKKIKKEIKSLTKQIHKKAEIEFNINSPKQVGEILFEKLKIKNERPKTSSGQYRTSEDALIEIKNEHPIVDMILKYRNLFKIQSTYIKPLIESIKNSKIHTNFLQTKTATGRLSSEKPNLQNIPKGTELAKKIRSSFESNKEYKLVSFDYSQLELRLLAHVSNDKNMKKAFQEGLDIHKTTASKIFNINIKNIKPEQRELAKTLNFGVVYGMGYKAFSKQSGLSTKKSKEFIEKYFKDFPSVKKWQEKTLEEAKINGYVKNINNRIRKIKGGGFMDRAAINMPIQSLGADIIKLSMIETYNHIKNEGIENKVKILLSIHDELLIEISDDIVKKQIKQIKNIMEKVSSLSVPLLVDIEIGKNWGNMKKIINV
ncbi:MAG: DNA polymerase [Candidatus Paceibacterota bacterium]